MLQIGFAEKDITPPLGQRIVGHFSDRFVEHVNDPLYARAMALEGSRPLLLVSCDLLSIRRSTVQAIRRRVEEALGVPGDCLSVSATHNHSGPITNRMFRADPDPAYLTLLEERASEAAIEAWQSRVPGALTVAYGFEGKLSHQRRFIMRDGSARMHPPKGSTDILYQEGPTDPEYAVIFARDAQGEPLGCWVNYSCHVNVAASGSTVTADYPGFLATALKRHLHPGFVTLFGNGCCGNLCQIDVYDAARPDMGLAWSEHMGEQLADDVLRVLPEGETLDEPLLDHRSVLLHLPLRHLPDDLLAWAERVNSAPEGDPAYASYAERCYAGMLPELLEIQRTEPLAPAELSAFRLGDYAVATLPAEVFVEFGLQIKLKSPAKRTWVMELTNGVVGYVPTERAFEGGGYEQRTCTSSKLDPVAGEMMVATARALLESMFR